MEEIRKIDDRLYGALYDICSPDNATILWPEISGDNDILREAIKVEKDKFGEKDILKGIAIARCMLRDFNNIDKDIYQELVNTIYSNKDIARCVLDGYSNGGDSYLLMTLWNPKLKLTEEQKAFAVEEAMNKIGTVKYANSVKEYEKELEMKGITDDQDAYLELGGSINPVGAKTGTMYVASIFNSLSDTQAHGSFPFDIRYWILQNHNWTYEEKAKLINVFYASDDTYDECLDAWEWDFLDEDSLLHDGATILEKYMLTEYTMKDLIELYDGDVPMAKKAMEQVDFFKLMHKLRPMTYEKEAAKVNVKS